MSYFEILTSDEDEDEDLCFCYDKEAFAFVHNDKFPIYLYKKTIYYVCFADKFYIDERCLDFVTNSDIKQLEKDYKCTSAEEIADSSSRNFQTKKNK